MTKYLVLWEHWEGSGDALPDVKEDIEKGTFKDWGVFATTGGGYVILETSNEVELFQLLAKYRKYDVRAISAEPVLSVEQVEKLRKG
jgi:hypothetical protein